MAMSRFMEHIIDFDESQLKIPRDNNINNNNQNNNQVNNTNLLDIIKNTLDNSINSLNIIQQENAKNNINNQQEQKLPDDNASVISSTPFQVIGSIGLASFSSSLIAASVFA